MDKEKNLFNEFSSVSLNEWKAKIEKDLKGKSLKSLNWENNEGIEIPPYFTKENSFKHDSQKNLRSAPLNKWKINQSIVVKNDKTANKTALQALQGGVNSITFSGNISNLTLLLKDIMLDIIEVNFVTETPLNLIKDINHYCNNNNIDVSKISGTISHDYINNSDLPLLKDVLAESNNTELRNIIIDNKNIQKAGANIPEQLAIAIAQGNEYLKNNINTDISKQFQFSLAIGNNYFFEVAKIRALRLLWSNVLNAYNIKNNATNIHCETSTLFWSKTDSENNILRGSSAGMSAILGGCDSLTITPHTLTNDDFSNRIAKNVQILLKEESYLDKVNDPANGSYYIEHLTNSIAAKSWAIFQEIEAQGGYSETSKNGYLNKLISKSAGKLVLDFNEGKIPLIGVTKYTSTDNQTKATLIKQDSNKENPFGTIVLKES